MFCPQCGRPVGQADRFCGQCGQPFDNAAPAVSVTTEPPPTEAKPPLAAQRPNQLPPHSVPWGLKEVALGTGLVLVSFLLVSGIALGLGLAVPAYKTAIVAWASSNLLGVAIVVVVLWLGPIRFRRPPSVLGLWWPPPLTLKTLAFTALAVGGSLGFTAAYAALVNWLGVKQLAPPQIPGDMVFPGLGSIATLQALAVVTPITEELFFRGFMFAGLVGRLGTLRAMLGSAVIFSLFHFDLGVIIPITITGLLFAWLYWRTNSLWPPILAHAIQNGLAVVATIYGVGSVV